MLRFRARGRGLGHALDDPLTQRFGAACLPRRDADAPAAFFAASSAWRAGRRGRSRLPFHPRSTYKVVHGQFEGPTRSI
jgi:hypothetical protein